LWACSSSGPGGPSRGPSEDDFAPVFCVFGDDLSDNKAAAHFARFIKVATTKDSPYFALIAVDCGCADVRKSAGAFCELAGARPDRMVLLAVDGKCAASCASLYAVLRTTSLVNWAFVRA